MTNETTKALLMILIIGGLLGAIYIPKIWASQQWTFLVRAMAHVRSAIVLTDRALQPAFIKRKSHKRQLLR
jgi:nitroreductase